MWRCPYPVGHLHFCRLLLKSRIHNSTSTSIHCYKYWFMQKIITKGSCIIDKPKGHTLLSSTMSSLHKGGGGGVGEQLVGYYHLYL